MLTSDLLVTKSSKGKIEPVYAKLDQENLEISGSLINLFQQHIGKTYGEIIEEIEGIEELDYRLIRGLTQLLERRCVIEMDTVIEPATARRSVFEDCKGAVSDEKERKEVIDRVARKLSVKSDALEKALWADMEENLIIKEFQTIIPEALLRQYNLSLTQTLLFKATGMDIQIEENYQEIFWKIKRLGLMYTIQDGRIYLDGAVSLFKMTERYGTALAKLLPTIMKCNKWSLKASILKKTMQGKRIYDFTLDNTRQIFSIEPDSNLETFDSAIEKEFSLLNFNSWSVKREPAVLKAGQYAFIPDFSLEKNDKRIYVEKLKNIKIALEGSVINLGEIARKYAVSLDAIKADIKQNNRNGYLLIGDQLIDNQTLKTVKSELNGVKKHSEALIIFGNYGIKSQQIFEILGYKVKWNGLDPENAEIVKI